MKELTNESILEDQVDIRHRAYMMTEKNMVIKKPSTQCNIGMLELICNTVSICLSPCRFLDHCDLGTTRCRQRRWTMMSGTRRTSRILDFYPNLFQDLSVRRSTLEHQVKLIWVGLYIAFQICFLVNMMNMNNSRHTYIWYNNNKVKKLINTYANIY
jgi:hypothetical protein